LSGCRLVEVAWSDPCLATKTPFPGVALAALKFLTRAPHPLHGHEPLDTDTTAVLEGESWLMHNGYTQAEGVANLDQVAESGCLVDDRVREVRRRRGRLRALHRDLAPPAGATASRWARCRRRRFRAPTLRSTGTRCGGCGSAADRAYHSPPATGPDHETARPLLRRAARHDPAGSGAGRRRSLHSAARGARLDGEGKTAEARVIFQKLIDEASDPAAKANAQRAMAMSYAFAATAPNAVKYEEMAIAYWATREQAEPQNAFFEEGELANETARVCIDAGDFATAERWYRRGSELGLKEPEPGPTRRASGISAWPTRWAGSPRGGATGRSGAPGRGGEKAPRRDTALARQQARYFPYLTGYVALYTNDLPTAEAELTRALAMPGNQNDPFMNCLLAMTTTSRARPSRRSRCYQKAYGPGDGT